MKGIPAYHNFMTDKRWLSAKGKPKLVSYLIMDHIEGFNLMELIENSERNERRLLHIFKKVIKILL